MRSQYSLTFKINNLSLRSQQDLYNQIINLLTPEQKDNLQITVEDPIGGIHNVWENKGTQPNGIECDDCTNVDCGLCVDYKGE